jgi:predicted kinase/8-oxo-dGTP pyrophosphatase MutT (NUDIX family)
MRPEVTPDEAGSDEMDKIRLHKLPGAINDEPARSAAYRLLHLYASRRLMSGKRKPVALNATYMPQRHRAELASLAVRSGAPLFVAQCVCSPEIAVKRFQERLQKHEEHAASDLTPVRVRQLAEGYERFDGALLVNTDPNHTVQDHVSRICEYIRENRPVDPTRWARHEYLRPPASAVPAEPDRTQKRLSEASVRAAIWRARGYNAAILVSIVFVVMGFFSVPTKIFRDLLCTFGPWYSSLRVGHSWAYAAFRSFLGTLITVLKRSLQEGMLVDWVQFGTWCLAVAGFASLIAAFYHDTKTQRQEAKSWASTGKRPRYQVLDQQTNAPSDKELYYAYKSRLGSAPEMAIQNVPVFFCVLPQYKYSFRTHIESGSMIESVLPEEAAKFGLDWTGFCLWRDEARQKEYPFAYSHEYGLGCVNLTSTSDGSPVCKMAAVRSLYPEYVCTEHSVNLVSPGVLPDMRRLLEGPGWDEGNLDVQSIESSARRYSMRMSATALILTRDNFFILQRRSQRVATGTGNLGAASSGAADYFADSDNRFSGLSAIAGRTFAKLPWCLHATVLRLMDWSRAHPTQWDLRKAALRETREEIGLRRSDFVTDKSSDNLVPPFERPFIGSAYNLLHGRDLNFYCCFRSKLGSQEISSRRDKHTRDKWEVDNLVFLESNKVTVSAIRQGQLDCFLPNRTRHLLGALYAWAIYAGRERSTT